MRIKSFIAAWALIAMPAVTAAEVEGPAGGASLREIQRQIGPMDPRTIMGPDGKSIPMLGPDGRPITPVRQLPGLLPGLGRDGKAAPESIIAEWRKRIEQNVIPIGPEAASDDLMSAAIDRGLGCHDEVTYRCRYAGALRRAGDRMAAAAAAAPDCEVAAANFRGVYEALQVASDIARAFDIACLGSFAPRLGDSVTGRPAVLAGAEADGLLDVVGLLEANGEIICAGLLTPNRKFVTARHCIRGNGSVALKVRLASKKLPAMEVRARNHPDWSKLGVAADWAVLDLEPGAALPIPASRLTGLDLPGEVSLVGMYRYAQPDVYAAGTVPFERDLRFPRNGLCQAVADISDCLQLACQTVRGFSGAPIIASRGSDGSVEVIGFLSGPESTSTGCMTGVNVRNSTFAVSAAAVQGI